MEGAGCALLLRVFLQVLPLGQECRSALVPQLVVISRMLMLGLKRWEARSWSALSTLFQRKACSLRPALEGVVPGAGAGAMDGAKPLFCGSTWLRMELSLEMRGAGAGTGTMEDDVTAA